MSGKSWALVFFLEGSDTATLTVSDRAQSRESALSLAVEAMEGAPSIVRSCSVMFTDIEALRDEGCLDDFIEDVVCVVDRPEQARFGPSAPVHGGLN